MKTRSLFKTVILAGILLALVSGCREGGPSSKVFVKRAGGDRIRVAVLPFDNVSRDQDAGRVVTNTAVTYLLSTGTFDVVEPGVVYNALGPDALRLSGGITLETCQKLQPKLNVDAFILGVVEEYGEVRIGPEQYPSISFSVRLVDAHSADILWAATISKTGAEKVKIFDIGRISSMGKLCKSAVTTMTDSLQKSRKDIIAGMKPRASTPSDVQQVGTTVSSAPSASTAPTQTVAATSAGGGKSARYLDEGPTYGEPDLKAFLKDAGSAKVGELQYKKHFHDTVETQYKLGDGKTVEVKLVDYRKVDTAKKFIQHYNPGETESTFEALPAFTNETGFGYYHLDMAAGRFGVYLRGPKGSKADIETLGRGLIDLLK